MKPSRARTPHTHTPAAHIPARLLAARAAGCILLAGFLAYFGVWRGLYVFDDHVAIDENPAMLTGDWWHVAFGPRHQPLANRPLTALTLTFDLAVFGRGPFGPHLTNLIVHLLNALLVFAVLRRSLVAPAIVHRFDTRLATRTAATVALLWVVHPLGADAVAYSTQRSTLLWVGQFLVALYATLRAHDSTTPARWRTVAVLAMAGAMLSKEDAVVGPLLLILFERAFLLPDWTSLRRRSGYYLAHILTWGLLVVCVTLGPSNPTVGYSTRSPVTAWEWLLTQAGVVLHYLRLVVWPTSLRGAYDWPVINELPQAILPGLAVVSLLGATVACWRRRPWWGWLGALFFLSLAPTSTIMPIVTEVVAERRAYLPMLFALIPIAVGLHSWTAKLPGRAQYVVTVTIVLVATLLGATTRARVGVYADDLSFWTDALSKRDPTNRSHQAGRLLASCGGVMLSHEQGGRAYECLDEAMRCADPIPSAVAIYASSLLPRGRAAEAVATMRTVIGPGATPQLLATLGVCLTAAHEAEHGAANDPRLAEAESGLRKGLVENPRSAQFWVALGYVLRVSNRLSEAEDAYRRATDASPDQVLPFLLRAELLERLGRRRDIAPQFERLLRARPRDVTVRLMLAEMAANNKEFSFAGRLVSEALALDPSNNAARTLSNRIQVESRR